MLTMHGIDVSVYETMTWNQDTRAYEYKANWERVRGFLIEGNPLDFVIIRASFGQYADVAYRPTLPFLHLLNADFSAYHAYHPGTSAIIQANVFLSQWELFPYALPPILDLELAGVTPDEIYVWLRKVEAGTGRKPMIYTRKYYWDDVMCKKVLMVRIPPVWTHYYPLWDANYTYTTAIKPIIPTGWKNYDMWQYSDKGLIPGLLGDVDMNVCPEDKFIALGGTVRRQQNIPPVEFPKTAVVVALAGLNVRTNPTEYSNIIDKIPCQVHVVVTEELLNSANDTWMHVKTASGKIGWMARIYKGNRFAVYL